MTAERTQQLNQKLQDLGQKLSTCDSLPVFLVAYHGDAKRGYFTVHWAGKEKPNLEETHRMLSAMLDSVAGQLGVT